jgi:guanylate kinase
MKKIILVGPGASGKDYLFDYLSNFYDRGIKYTTRPKRDNEIENYTYYYYNNNQFINMINNKEMSIYEHFEKQDWYYGYSQLELNTKELFIMTPNEIKQINDLSEYFIVYLNIDRYVRKFRLLNRSDEDSIKNRLIADDESFKDFNTYDYVITNEIFDCHEIYTDIDELI